MTKLASQISSDEEAWRLAIGGFFWRMGQLEFLTYEWCLHLGGVCVARYRNFQGRISRAIRLGSFCGGFCTLARRKEKGGANPLAESEVFFWLSK
jgi:hypothetical protein